MVFQAAARSKAPVSGLALAAIMSLYVVSAEFTVLTPALQVFSERFSTTPYEIILLANTITGVVSVPVSVLCGKWVDRWGCRRVAIAGFALVLAGGSFPFLLPDISVYYPVIASRFLVGVGLGLVAPLGGLMVMTHFDGIEGARWLGIGNFVTFAFSVAFTIASGYLCAQAWNYTFLVYLIAVVPFCLVVFFLPEVKPPVRSGERVRKSLPYAVGGYALLTVAAVMLLVTVPFLNASLLAQRDLGGPAVSGFITSAYNIGAIIVGLTFAFLLSRVRRRVFSVFALLGGAGLLVVVFSQSAAVMFLGSALAGLAHNGFLTACQQATSVVVRPDQLPLANGLIIAATNLGSFLSPYWILATGELVGVGTASPVLAGGVIMLVAAVAMAFFPFKVIGASEGGK